jgi:hypothetical protein
MITIAISAEIKRRVLKDYPVYIEGTIEENIICALIALSMKPTNRFNAAGFFNRYKTFCDIADQGARVDFSVSSDLKGQPVSKDIKSLKGKRPLIFSRETIRKIAYFISGGNQDFCAALDEEFVYRVGAAVTLIKHQPSGKNSGASSKIK